MKYLWTAVFLLSILIVTADASQLPDFPFVFARGEAKTDVAPDKAKVSFRIVAFEKDSKKAMEVVFKRSSEVLAYLAEEKIKKEDIIAHDIYKKATREKKGFKRLKIIGYEMGRRISFSLWDLGMYDRLLKKLLAFENVDNINASFDKKDRKKIEADLIAEAGRDARHQAELMAKGFGTPLGSVFAISKQEFSYLPNEFGISGFGRPLAKALGIGKMEVLSVPEIITIRSGVSVIFKLKVD